MIAKSMSFELRLLLVVAWAAVGSGCGRQAPDSNAPSAATGTVQAAVADNMPPVPPSTAGTEGEAVAMEILVRNPASATKAADAYQAEGEIPSGTIVGLCTWAAPDASAKPLPPRKLDLRKGKWAIPDPAKGEVEYYENIGLTEPEGRSLEGAVVRIRDVKKGNVPMLARANFILKHGRFRPPMCVAPVGERVGFATYDFYPTDVTVVSMRDGRGIFQGVVSAYSAENIRSLGGGGVQLKMPEVLQSESLRDLGVYEIRSRRHPWMSARVITVDNPYAAVTDRGGRFTMADVPAGEWTLEIWHADLDPVERTMTVTVFPDRTAEAAFQLASPAGAQAAAQ